MLLARIEAATRGRGSALAIADEQQAVSFAELLTASRARAAELRRAGSPQLILLALPGGAALTIWQLAAIESGAVAAPIPATATEHELRQYLHELTPQLAIAADPACAQRILSIARGPCSVIGADEPVPQLAGSAPRLPEDVRLLQFTSGSTARPKGILLTEANLCADLDAQQAHLAQFHGRNVFLPLPQFHAMGNAVVLEHLAAGSGVVCSNRFAPAEDRRRLLAHGCDHVATSPHWVRLWCAVERLTPARTPFRGFTLGTASVDPPLVDELRALWPDAQVHVRYGLSEAVGALTRLDLGPGELLAQPGLVGPPVPGVELRAPATTDQAPRELVVRCAMAARAQWHDGAVHPLLDPDGWLATGDFGRLDAHGNLHLAGRASAFVKVQGHRVSPFEIEAVLRAVPGVQEAVVVGIPDRASGARLVAFVERAAAAEALDVERLRAHCESHLAAYKVPARFELVALLPRTPSGKPDRPRLQSIAEPCPPPS